MAGAYVDAEDLLIKRLATGPLKRPWRIAFRREEQQTAERLRGALVAASPRLRDAR
jgi:LysR family transcriptional regulator for metE and metH